MGDGADMALDACMTMDALQLDYLGGGMSIQEAMDCGVLDEHGELPYGSTWPTRKRSRPAAVTCRCCGETGLRWMNHEGKWLLGDGTNLHDCPKNPYAPNAK